MPKSIPHQPRPIVQVMVSSTFTEATAPPKILVSSWLAPRVLLNPSGQPITGAKRITLPGLRPSDAERLLRSCGIEGDDAAIQSYITTNCDNHMHLIGILGKSHTIEH